VTIPVGAVHIKAVVLNGGALCILQYRKFDQKIYLQKNLFLQLI